MQEFCDSLLVAWAQDEQVGWCGHGYHTLNAAGCVWITALPLELRNAHSQSRQQRHMRTGRSAEAANRLGINPVGLRIRAHPTHRGLNVLNCPRKAASSALRYSML